MKHFTPSTDKTYMLIFAVALLLTLVSTLLIFFEDAGAIAYYVTVFVVLLIGVIIWMTYRIEFTIDDHIFTSKFGPFSFMVDLRNVVKITDRYSIFSTPSVLKVARSNKTISLRYKKQNSVALSWITIALKEEKEFIKEVLIHSPKAELELKRIKLQ